MHCVLTDLYTLKLQNYVCKKSYKLYCTQQVVHVQRVGGGRSKCMDAMEFCTSDTAGYSELQWNEKSNATLNADDRM